MMLKHLIAFFLIACSIHADEGGLRRHDDQCGNPTDGCMNEENWNQCRSLVEQGCQMIQIMESCPLQFACGDAERGRRRQEMERKNKQRPKACVSLLVYRDAKCQDGPVRSVTFPTLTKPGSPCYTDASMGHFAVKDQYCDLETGYWHEMVFPNNSPTCDVPWYHRWWAPMNLTFTPDKCVGGYMLDYCKKGKCPKDDSYGDEEHGSSAFEWSKDTIPIIQDGVVVGTM